MATATTLEFHPAANLFPLDDENLDELAEDIKTNGQLLTIELLDGRIIDGRRRYMACNIAGVAPRCCDVHPDDPIAYVLSLNLHRRHLSTTQRGIVAARAREMYEERATKRREAGQQSGGRGHKKENSVENLPPSLDAGKTRDAAGKAVGVSGKTVDYATRVLEKGIPELVEACEQDKIAISTAAKIAAYSPETQAELVSKTKMRPKPGARKEDSPDEPESEPGKSRGVGVARANEAIDCLKRIPKNDALRKRGFQIVTDWIRHNK